LSFGTSERRKGDVRTLTDVVICDGCGYVICNKSDFQNKFAGVSLFFDDMLYHAHIPGAIAHYNKPLDEMPMGHTKCVEYLTDKIRHAKIKERQANAVT